MSHHNLDRFDISIALQVWQKFFMLSLYVAKCVSNQEEDWATKRDTALEYLARGRLFDVMGRFCDGVASDISEAAQKGVALIRDDVDALNAELNQAEAEARKLLHARLVEICEDEHGRVQAELERVPEMRAEHRALFPSEPVVALAHPERGPYLGRPGLRTVAALAAVAGAELEPLTTLGEPAEGESPEQQAARVRQFWR